MKTAVGDELTFSEIEERGSYDMEYDGYILEEYEIRFDMSRITAALVIHDEHGAEKEIWITSDEIFENQYAEYVRVL